jgi:hypothetical protein
MRGGRSCRPWLFLVAVFGILLICTSCTRPTMRGRPVPFEEVIDEEMVIGEESPISRGRFVRIGPDGRTFRRGQERFIPFGCNYYDHETGWPPHLWEQFDAARVEEHFAVMESLGVNCVRVFLTAQSFFSDGESLNQSAISKLETMLSIAHRHGIPVQVTGPDHWEGTPEWREGDFYTSGDGLSALIRFWQLFAGRFRKDPRIFSYDLLNEPHLRWDSPQMQPLWPEWLRGRYSRLSDLRESWGDTADEIRRWKDIPIPEDKDDPGSVALYDYQCFREDVATNWVAVQCEAIQSVDPNHLITVGLIQWSVPLLLSRPSQYAAVNPFQIAPYVDFMTVHFYPLAGDPLANEENFERNLAYLEAVVRYVDVGLPIVLGEFGWYGGGAVGEMPHRSGEDQAGWNQAVLDRTDSICAGWFNWALADTPVAHDLSLLSGLVAADLATKPWGEEFRRRARLMDRNRPRYRSAMRTLRPDYRQVLTSSEASRATLTGFQDLAREFKRPGIRPHERLLE